MKLSRAGVVIAVILAAVTQVRASGTIGIYAIVEKVVLEPNDKAPTRIQVWGAFAYADGVPGQGGAASNAKRGYLYFRLPDANTESTLKEWADLKAIAGTGQAIGFGYYGYIGRFSDLQPDASTSSPPRSVPPYTLLLYPGGGSQIELRVRAASEPVANPVVYATNSGIVKLTATGSHAAIVSQLKKALGQ
jgi:hypothetical protein